MGDSESLRRVNSSPMLWHALALPTELVWLCWLEKGSTPKVAAFVLVGFLPLRQPCTT